MSFWSSSSSASAIAAKVEIDPKVNTKQESVVPLITPAMKATELRLLRGKLLGGKKHGERKINGIMHNTVPMTIVAGAISMATNSGGVLQFSFGWSTLIAASDYTNLQALFEVVRVRQLRWYYEPVNPNQLLASPALAIHLPIYYSYDPNTSAAVAFTALAASRPLSDKRNHLTTTNKSARIRWDIEEKTVGVINGSAALTPTLGQWNDTGSTIVTGGMLVSAVTFTANPSILLGVAMLEYECDFAYRI